LHVIVVGGGIAGLCLTQGLRQGLAYGLRQAGVTAVEIRARLRGPRRAGTLPLALGYLIMLGLAVINVAIHAAISYAAQRGIDREPRG